VVDCSILRIGALAVLAQGAFFIFGYMDVPGIFFVVGWEEVW